MKEEHLSTLSQLKERMDLIKTQPGVIKNDDINLVYSFAGKIASKEYLGGLIQAVVLFGSVMRKEARETSDLDVLVLIDDVSNEITSEMASAYSLTVSSLMAKLNAQDKLHLTTLGIIRFWDGVRNGDPVIMSILRSGKPIVDTGFFNPLKAMLEKGMIKPSKEAVDSHMKMAETLLRNMNYYYLRSISDAYWAVMDATHAAVMHAGEEPTHPKEAGRKFAKIAPKIGLSPGMAGTVEKFVETMKSITHGERKSFTGRQVDEYWERAEEFIKAVKKAIEK